MPTESIRLSSRLPASAARIYTAWLDGTEHTRMTGGPAKVDPRVGGRHMAWDDYIEGVILELEPGARIVQSWRTSEFPEGHPDSRLEIRLRDVPEGCEVVLVHTEIPDGQGEKYEAGWQGHYFNPMTKYFRENAETLKDALPKPKPAKARPAKKVAKAVKKVAAPKKAAKAAKKIAKPKKAAKRTAKPKKAAVAKKVAKRAPARKAKKKAK